MASEDILDVLTGFSNTLGRYIVFGRCFRLSWYRRWSCGCRRR
jgi:hypothetical protein